MDWRIQRDIVRRWGGVRFLYGHLATLLRSLGVRIVLVLRRPLHGAPPTHRAEFDVETRIVEWDELFRCSRDPDLDLSEEFLRDARSRDELCVGAFHDGRLVAYAWRAVRPTPAVDGMWVRFDPPNRYGYKAFTLPEYRGRGLHSVLAPVADELHKKLGYTHAVSYIEADNYASIRSARRHGAIPTGYAATIVRMGRKWGFSTRGAKRLGFAFFDPSTE
jgi:GNAT superfamily N-acetyltransferase